jgi:hypothetical protein
MGGRWSSWSHAIAGRLLSGAVGFFLVFVLPSPAGLSVGAIVAGLPGQRLCPLHCLISDSSHMSFFLIDMKGAK